MGFNRRKMEDERRRVAEKEAAARKFLSGVSAWLTVSLPDASSVTLNGSAAFCSALLLKRAWVSHAKEKALASTLEGGR
jgi:hypothetical protein